MKGKTAIYWSLIAFWLILLIVLSSCDPVKRHSRLVNRFPHVHRQDTLVIKDTIRATIPAEKSDTVVLYQSLRDTLYIDKERIKIRIHTILDSVYVNAECKEVIIEKIVERKIPIVYYKDKKEKNYLSFSLFGLLIFLVLLVLFRKKD
jgi:hypothetical protein